MRSPHVGGRTQTRATKPIQLTLISRKTQRRGNVVTPRFGSIWITIARAVFGVSQPSFAAYRHAERVMGPYSLQLAQRRRARAMEGHRCAGWRIPEIAARLDAIDHRYPTLFAAK